jgi:phospholipase A-2-activating protein
MSGLVVSGGSDKIIFVTDPCHPSEPLFTLLGHEDNVCSLSVTQGGLILSASWDK